jgi:LmbE family N-acetylglucosaminyl deacetylase
MASVDMNRPVDVTTTIDRKIAALRRHVSQNTDSDEMADRIRTWLAARAETAGLPAGSYAEGFFVIDTAG